MTRNNVENAIVGEAYEEPKKLVEKYSKKSIPLLLLGETGSGKELFANLYMEKSERKGEKRTINCSAYSDQLLRSEIFGHVKGAYTDAKETRKGLIKTCEGGIVFLDEIDSSSQEFQALILRVVEKNSYTKLGSDDEKTSDVLFIGAIKINLGIRKDLIHRFNILFIPPLQNFDIPAIVSHLLGCPLKDSYLKKLISREYPGNVRELKKQCDKMLVEEGDKIFSKTKEKRLTGGIRFNYNQFRHEFELWQKHIQPIIKKHGLVDINYKYNKKTIEESDEYLEIIFNEEIPGGYTYLDPQQPSTVKAIIALTQGVLPVPEQPNEKNPIETFKKNLKLWIEQGELYTVLNLLESEENVYKNISRTAIKGKPYLTKLLDLIPFKKAKNKFRQAYVKYHLEKNKGDKKTTSEELDVSVRSLNRYLKE